MQSPGSRVCSPWCWHAAWYCPACASFAATPSFTIAAANVTMPSGGNDASSQFTLTSVNGYAGQVRVGCAYSGGMMGAKVPTCGIYINPVFAWQPNSTRDRQL